MIWPYLIPAAVTLIGYIGLGILFARDLNAEDRQK